MRDRDHVAHGEGAAETCDEAGFDMPLHIRSLRQLSSQERALYETALALLSSGGGVQALVRDGNLPLAGLGVYEALLTRSWAVRFEDKAEMVRLALVAVEVSKELDSESLGEKHVVDLQARAWAELANAYRAADRLRSADKAFGQAFALFAQGTGDPYMKARLFDFEGSLLGTWRNFSLAEDRLELAARLYHELGETHLAGRALITRALYAFYSCKPEEAFQFNKQGLGLIDPERDQALFLMALHNELLFLVDLGRYREAKRALFKGRERFIYRDDMGILRLRWIEGRIDYGLGNLVSAEITFRQVKEGFDRVNLPFSSALARLDLAMALLSLDRFDEAEAEVLEARDLFLSIEVYREFLGAVIFLEEVFRRRTVTPAMIQSAITHIWRKNLQIGPRHFR